MLRRLSYGQIYVALAILLAFALCASASIGASSFPPDRIVHLLLQAVGIVPPVASDTLDRNIFIQLRLPRVCVAALTGAVLSVSGTLMQGLFRNPIVEPGLAGT